MEHMTIDIWFADGVLESIGIDGWDGFMQEVCDSQGMTVLNRCSHDFGKPGAITSLFLLSTSHTSVHTWPELRYAAFDLFTCGDPISPTPIHSILDGMRGVMHYKSKTVRRGPTDASI